MSENHILVNTDVFESDNNTNEIMEEEISSPPTDMTIYESRLTTYIGWPLSYISPEQMANAGFYYLGKKDNVKCAFCSIELNYWNVGEDPTDEHKKKSPCCAFFRRNGGYDVCGINIRPTFDLSSTIDNQKIQELLLDAGIVIKINQPHHKQFSSLTTRLNTFNMWDTAAKPVIQTLCEAGFLFVGIDGEDQLICFYCNKSLNNWTNTDEPWTEHARWSPNCSFLLLNKGKEFVDQVCDMTNNVPRIRQEFFFKLIANIVEKPTPEHENATMIDTIEHQMSRILLVDQERRANVSINGAAQQEQEQQEQIVVKPRLNAESILCKVCNNKKACVVFLPCAHLVACIQCTVESTQCIVCKYPLDLAMTVNVHMKQVTTVFFPWLVYSNNLPQDLMLCKVCRKNDLGSVFVPCKHVYACAGCAKNMIACPACLKDVCTTMKINI